MAFLENTRYRISNWIKPESSTDVFFGQLDSILSANIGKISTDRALKCQVVFNSVNLLSNSISEVRFHAKDHKMLDDQLQYPNVLQNQADFMSSLVKEVYLEGDSFIQYDGTRMEPRKMRLISRNDIRIEKDANGDPVYFDITDKSNPKRLYNDNKEENTNVFRIRDFPTANIDTYRRIDAMADKINALLFMDKYMYTVMRSGIDLGHIFSSVMDLDKESKEEAREILKAFSVKLSNSDGNRQGSYAFMPKGVEVKTLKRLSPADADVVQSYILLASNVAHGGFGIPESMIVGMIDPKYSNFTASKNTFYTMALSPMITKVVRAFEHEFDCTIIADDWKLQLGDFNANANTAGVLSEKKLWLPNEIRERFWGMEPVEGGNKFADVSNISINTGNGDSERPRSGEQWTDDGTEENPNE